MTCVRSLLDWFNLKRDSHWQTRVCHVIVGNDHKANSVSKGVMADLESFGRKNFEQGCSERKRINEFSILRFDSLFTYEILKCYGG